MQNKLFGLVSLHIAIFSLVFLSRLPYLLDAVITMSEWDAVARFHLAFKQQDGIVKYFFPNISWLPFQFYIMRFVRLFSNNLEVYLYFSVFLFSLSFNFLFEALRLASRQVESQKYIFIYCVCSSMVPIIYFNSMTTLSEPIYIFLMSIGFYVFVRVYYFNRSIFPLIIAFTVSNLVRYEAWVVNCLLSCVVLYRFRSLKLALKLSLLVAVPLIWTWLSFRDSGDPFYWLFETGLDAKAFYLDNPSESAFTVTIKILKPLIYFVIASFPVVYFFKIKKENLSLLYTWLIFTLIVILKISGKGVELSLRYSIPVLILTIFLMGIHLFSQDFKIKNVRIMCTIFLVCILGTNCMTSSDARTSFGLFHSDSLSEGIEKLSSLKIDSKNKLLVPRVHWFPELIRLRLNLVNSRNLVPYVNDEYYANRPKELWQIYKKYSAFSRPDIAYIALVKDETPKGYLIKNLPVKIKENFNLYWSNDFMNIYKKKI